MLESLSGIALSFLVLAGAAGAAPPRLARLQYERAPGADRCPDQAQVELAVAQRLGYDPFAEPAATVIASQVAPRGPGLAAHLELRSPQGELLGERDIPSRTGDCADLADAMVLAISLAIDPLALARPKPAAQVSQAPAPPAPPLHPPAHEPDPVPLRLQIAAGLTGSLGARPSPGLGAAVEARLRREGLSVGLQGRAELPARVALAGGEVETSLLTGAVIPCAHLAPLALCALAQFGTMRVASSGLVGANKASTAYAAAGARIVLQPRLGERLSLPFSAELAVPLVRTTLRSGTEEVWSSPAVEAGLGAGIAVEL